MPGLQLKQLNDTLSLSTFDLVMMPRTLFQVGAMTGFSTKGTFNLELMMLAGTDGSHERTLYPYIIKPAWSVGF